MLLGKFGFSWQQVRAMCHAEVYAWVESALQSLGVSRKSMRPTQQMGVVEETTSYVFTRRKRGT